MQPGCYAGFHWHSRCCLQQLIHLWIRLDCTKLLPLARHEAQQAPSRKDTFKYCQLQERTSETKITRTLATFRVALYSFTTLSMSCTAVRRVAITQITVPKSLILQSPCIWSCALSTVHHLELGKVQTVTHSQIKIVLTHTQHTNSWQGMSTAMIYAVGVVKRYVKYSMRKKDAEFATSGKYNEAHC